MTEKTEKTEEEERPDRMYYLGDGRQGFAGVPRRDLTKEDTARLKPSQWRDILASTLYQKSKPKGRETESDAPKGDSGKGTIGPSGQDASQGV